MTINDWDDSSITMAVFCYSYRNSNIERNNSKCWISEVNFGTLQRLLLEIPLPYYSISEVLLCYRSEMSKQQSSILKAKSVQNDEELMPGLEFLDEAKTMYVFIDTEWLEVYINTEEPDEEEPILVAHITYPLTTSRFISCIRKFFLYMSNFKIRMLDKKYDIMYYVERNVSSCKYWIGWLLFCGAFGNWIKVVDLYKTSMGKIAQSPSCPGCLLITDENDLLIYKIKGSCLCEFSLCCFRPSATYKILSPNGKRVGSIKKLNYGLYNDILTSNRAFHIDFPDNMHSKHKNLIFCSVFLLNFIYYQK